MRAPRVDQYLRRAHPVQSLARQEREACDRRPQRRRPQLRGRISSPEWEPSGRRPRDTSHGIDSAVAGRRSTRAPTRRLRLRDERLVAVVAVLEQHPAVLELGEQRRRFPPCSMLSSIVPTSSSQSSSFDGDERMSSSGPASRTRSSTGTRDGPSHECRCCASAGGQHGIVAAPAGQEVTDPASGV